MSTDTTAYLTKEHDYGDRWVFGIDIQTPTGEKWIVLGDGDEVPSDDQVRDALAEHGWIVIAEHNDRREDYFRRYELEAT